MLVYNTFEASVIIVVGDVGGMDVDIVFFFVNLKGFIKDHCIACFMERGCALTYKHFQMVVKGSCPSLPVLKKNMKVCLG